MLERACRCESCYRDQTTPCGVTIACAIAVGLRNNVDLRLIAVGEADEVRDKADSPDKLYNNGSGKTPDKATTDMLSVAYVVEHLFVAQKKRVQVSADRP